MFFTIEAVTRNTLWIFIIELIVPLLLKWAVEVTISKMGCLIIIIILLITFGREFLLIWFWKGSVHWILTFNWLLLSRHSYVLIWVSHLILMISFLNLRQSIEIERGHDISVIRLLKIIIIKSVLYLLLKVLDQLLVIFNLILLISYFILENSHLLLIVIFTMFEFIYFIK